MSLVIFSSSEQQGVAPPFLRLDERFTSYQTRVLNMLMWTADWGFGIIQEHILP